MSRAAKSPSKRKKTKAHVQFGKRRQYDPPLNRFGDRGRRRSDRDPDDFDQILGNFGDWGSQ